MYDVVFYHQTLPVHPMRRSFDGLGEGRSLVRQFRLAVESVVRHVPRGRPVLLSGDDPPLIDDIAVERRPLVDHALLQIDRSAAYRDYVAARVGAPGGVIFLDTDTLVLRDLADMFSRPFDVALTYAESSLTPPPPLDHWGLPTDGRQSAINGGVMAARYSAGAVQFFDAALDRLAAIAAEGKRFLSGGRNLFLASDFVSAYRIRDIRIWGGAQFALTSLVSAALFRGPQPENALVGGSEIAFLPSAVWNRVPHDDHARDDFTGAYIVHLKGGKKRWTEEIARRCGIEPARTLD